MNFDGGVGELCHLNRSWNKRILWAFFCASKCYLSYLRHFVFCKPTFQSIDHPAKLMLWKMMPHVERSDSKRRHTRNIRCASLKSWEMQAKISDPCRFGVEILGMSVEVHCLKNGKLSDWLCLSMKKSKLIPKSQSLVPRFPWEVSATTVVSSIFLGGMGHVKRIEWTYIIIPEFRRDASFQKGSPFPAGHLHVPCLTLGAYVTQKNWCKCSYRRMHHDASCAHSTPWLNKLTCRVPLILLNTSSSLLCILALVRCHE